VRDKRGRQEPRALIGHHTVAPQPRPTQAAGQLAPDGRHELAEDQRSWHILLLDNGGRVGGCLRYVEAEAMARFDQLWIHQCALARCPVWGTKFRRAVEMEMARARCKGFGFGEVGGWAVREDRRRTIDPLRMVLAACGLFRRLGGCAGLATATVRHGSASILRRIGLTSLSADGLEIPSYYDPRYRCHMEALRFDSEFPSPRYAAAIEADTVLSPAGTDADAAGDKLAVARPKRRTKTQNGKTARRTQGGKPGRRGAMRQE